MREIPKFKSWSPRKGIPQGWGFIQVEDGFMMCPAEASKKNCLQLANPEVLSCRQNHIQTTQLHCILPPSPI